VVEQYNEPIDISVGKSRKETSWKHKSLTWPTIVDKLRETHRTKETYKEYMSSKPDRQAEIKDIGGFVGGYMNAGRRKRGSVISRQLLALDLDYAKPNCWRKFKLLYDVAACIHTTHKHNPDEPRFRLLIPLSRTVNSVEYEAIGRRVAGNIDIEQFDNTGFQFERLMYWPSTSADGVYEFAEQVGEFLDVDSVLGSYRNWRNIYEWPVSDRYTVQVLDGMRKAGNPLEKPGAIGAFCSAYSLTEAIYKFLPETYYPTDQDDRFTYAGATTSGGGVVYDDLWLYSYHDSDPVCNKLVNAYDLVRIHLFGHLDEDRNPETPINKLPSSLAMGEWAVKDKEVRRLIVNAKMEDAAEAFKDMITPEVLAEIAGNDADGDNDNEEWKTKLDVGKGGVLQSTINNVLLIMENDPYMKGRFAFNEFEHREVAIRAIPWRKVHRLPAPLTDTDDAAIRYYLEKTYGISAAGKIDDALKLLMAQNSFHPIKDYLDSCLWDGEPRLERLFVDYLGAEDTEYVRAVTRKAFVAAVARIYEPGIKFDYVLTLIGEEGKEKSTILQKMFGYWFSDSFAGVTGSAAFEQLQGTWGMEIGELAGFKRADVEAVKHFISKCEDRYRVAYGRRLEYFPRTCVFFGTSNKSDFLISEHGNRRFWPVVIDHDTPALKPSKMTPETVRLLWAEAVEMYNSGETLFLDSTLETLAREVQAEHLEHDDRAGDIVDFINMLLPINWYSMGIGERRDWIHSDSTIKAAGVIKRTEITAAEIWTELFQNAKRDMSIQNTRFIHRTLEMLKTVKRMQKRKNVPHYGKQVVYVVAETARIKRSELLQ